MLIGRLAELAANNHCCSEHEDFPSKSSEPKHVGVDDQLLKCNESVDVWCEELQQGLQAFLELILELPYGFVGFKRVQTIFTFIFLSFILVQGQGISNPCNSSEWGKPGHVQQHFLPNDQFCYGSSAQQRFSPFCWGYSLGLFWDAAPPSNSHHQDYYNLSRQALQTFTCHWHPAWVFRSLKVYSFVPNSCLPLLS